MLTPTPLSPLSPPAWRPIESAPKDGTEVLLSGPCLDPNYNKRDVWMYVGTGYWSEHQEAWLDNDFPIYPPTYWMPLPEPPASEPIPTGGAL